MCAMGPKVLVLVLATLHLTHFHHTVLSLEIDNSLLGVPEIDCKTETIEMRFRTRRRFAGKIYVQGHYSNPDCIVDYSQTTADGSPIGGIKLHHGSCDMDRQRMVQPEGMQFSTTFVTKTDRAFHINCLYREAVRAVTAGLTVSPLPTVTVAYDMPMPVCTYTIRKDNLDGPILRYAKVGDQVVHRWHCDSEMYGMLVHSCFVEDGQGEKRMVIDERGCHIDQIVLGDPTYTEDLNLAYRESYVFKFADRVGVRFSCEIKLCVKEDGGCSSIVVILPKWRSQVVFNHAIQPPSCGPDYQKDLDMQNALPHNNTQEDDPLPGKVISKQIFKRHSNPENTASSKAAIAATADLISQYVYVLDTVEGADTDHFEEQEKLMAVPQVPQYRTPICLSSAMFAAVLMTVAFAFAFATILILHVLFRQLRPRQQVCRSSSSSEISAGNVWSSGASPTKLIFQSNK